MENGFYKEKYQGVKNRPFPWPLLAGVSPVCDAEERCLPSVTFRRRIVRSYTLAYNPNAPNPYTWLHRDLVTLPPTFHDRLYDATSIMFERDILGVPADDANQISDVRLVISRRDVLLPGRGPRAPRVCECGLAARRYLVGTIWALLYSRMTGVGKG